ncbi:tryptophan halogenase family protein [Sphingomonas rubra]|uniref:Tryptophan halogenase n=1 Tax=Sphingomonas rubra TaxID=634430 RepID=A0A1I5URM6_9SPHN|nr:tryptophan halogenase family protein [Sphingomonas rubra]SFP97376.1 tryptophan halogenase [Sphingomonas rubra]
MNRQTGKREGGIRRVVIAGGGTAGWMTAAAVARTMGAAIELVLVESDAIGTVGVGESTIPPLVTYNRLLGINEADFMRETQATFKLGILFDEWKERGSRYFHSFGLTGKDHWSAGFQHFWLYGRHKGHQHPYDDYCLELLAAMAGKFAHLPDDQMNYAYQLDSTLYARFLRRLAEADGTRRVEGKIARVELDEESGDIARLVLDSGTHIEGDLFIDCTGFRALLIEGALHAGFEDWTHWLPCDAAIAVQTENVAPPVPYTRAMAHDAGWQWRIPLQHRTGNGIVYCSRYLDREQALERLLGNIEGTVLTEPNALRFVTGMRRRQWHRNCVAIGLSGGFMEPLESTSIHLIQRAVLRLLRLFPVAGISERDVTEFNDQQLTDAVQIRDFLILHYKATDRRDSAFWRQCAAMPIPDTLHHKIELFRETGRVFRRNEELFAENSWVQVMMGQGIVPQSWHPIAAKLRDDELDRLLGTIRDTMRRTVAGLPDHAAYVAQYCGARRGSAR